jgi:uncharacterized damage-inducible protein DinB
VIATITAEYRRYKSLGETAIAQLDEADLARASGEDNSIAVIVWHIGGNLRSRFTDFLTTDGEKPWRDRDEEFEARVVTRSELLAKWELGWQALFEALASLTDDDLEKNVTIRGRPLAVSEALLRSLAHTSYHVGQIVYIAKSLRGAAWQTLSIPKGASKTYNANPGRESADQHAAMLDRRRQQ